MERVSGDFISLSEATMYCEHSQDYLNLLARKGKLRALKMGRNWVTTREWLQNYSLRMEQKKVKRIRSLFISEAAGARFDNFAAPQGIAKEAPTAEVRAASEKNRARVFKRSIRPAGVLTSCCAAAFLFASFAFNFFPAHNFLVAYSQTAARQILVPAGSMVNNFGSRIAASFSGADAGLPSLKIASADVAEGDFLGAIGRAFAFLKNKILAVGGYLFHGKTEVVAVSGMPAPDLKKSVDKLQQDIASDTRTRFDDFKKEINVDGAIPLIGPPAQGVIVLPLAGDIDAQKEKIKESFSDEVTVRAHDASSGVIIPEFRDKKNDQYLYMMVPVNNNNQNK
jgi:hypothetical protein